MIRFIPCAGLALAVLVGTASGNLPEGQPVPEGTFDYRVVHPTLGDIGTYTNVVRRNDGGSVSVATRVDIEAKIAFVTARSIEADRSEQWSEGRLVQYESGTLKDGEAIHVQGRSEGGQFVIEGPAGRATAPASVVPTNAWSPHILEADVVMASESGRLYPASVTGGGRENVEVEGEQVSARRYRVSADSQYDLWFDDDGRVVRFATVSDGDTISFVLD